MASSSSSSPEIIGANSDDHFSYKHATHDEVLEDLSSRFILNLPDDELSSLERICFQVEQAHWFYEDFIREENPKLPSLPLKKFSAMLFHACPLLHQWSDDHEQAFNTFMQYKTRVPVCGAIMLNETWEKCLLVKGWKSSSGWGFPKGKINEVEPPTSCAIREVLEETGYNLTGQINPKDVIELSIKEQKISLYIVPGVPEDYPFKTKTRKEISKIEWFKLTELPTWKRNKTAAGRFYLISPFIGPLKTFLNDRKFRNATRKSPKTKKPHHAQRKQPAFEVSRDVRHDSSSQSSSAENGEPQTPCPYYTDAQATSIPRIATTDVPLSSQSDIPMDPHFAHLLSALATSATSAAKPTDHESNPPSTAETNRPSKELTTPVPASASTIASMASPDSVLSAKQPISPLVSEVHLTAAGSHSMYHSGASTHLSVPSSRRAVRSQDLHQALNGKGSDYLRFPPPSEPHVFKPALSSQGGPVGFATSSRSFTSRLPSNAGISPYLTRPSRPATPSADRIKHIALLEAASAESARLMHAYKTAAANGVPINIRDNFKYPVTPGLVAGSSLAPQFSDTCSNNVNSSLHPLVLDSDFSNSRQVDNDIFYASYPSSTHFQAPPVPTLHKEALGYLGSSTLHPPPSGSVNQSQTVHGSHLSSNSPHLSIPRSQVAGSPSGIPSALKAVHPKLVQQEMVGSTLDQFSRKISHIPSSAVQLPQQRPASNTLLSILNNARNSSGATNTTPFIATSGGGSARPTLHYKP